MSAGPSLNVWTLGQGASGRWKLHLTTSSLGEAEACFNNLEQAGKQVAIYELGLFEHEGEQVAGQVGFKWSANFNDYMETEPQGRGIGWTEDFDTWVTYNVPTGSQPVPSTSELVPAVRPAKVEEPVERYVERACQHCGLILPMNQLRRLTHDVQTGRSSGTTRSSRSTTTRFSSRSFSNSNSFGSSSSSGRRHYKTETLILCKACYTRQRKVDRNLLGKCITIGFWLLILVFMATHGGS